MADRSQTFANHRQQVPLYLLVFFIFVVNFGWAIYRLVKAPGGDTGMALAVAVALILLFFYARRFALTVQNRIIRLEMRLRLRELLPTDQHARIGDFTLEQLIALRFACDAELPALAARVLKDGVKDQTTIKKMIVTWEGDYLRA